MMLLIFVAFRKTSCFLLLTFVILLLILSENPVFLTKRTAD